MNINTLKNRIKQNDRLKKICHSLLMSKQGSCPRKWVKWFLNPFMLEYGKGSLIRKSAIMNVSFINRFCLGSQSVIEHFAVVDNGVGEVVIGDNSRIGIHSTVIGPVKIGNNVILGQNIVVSGLNHSYQDIHQPICYQKVETDPIVIGDGSWVGANSVIVAGVKIGKHVTIGGGSVVTKDVPDYSVIAGNPARIIKRYSTEKGEWVINSDISKSSC